MVESPCSSRDSQESSPTPQFKSINSSVLCFLYNPLQCSCLENPGMGEPGGLPSMGLNRVGHNWSELAAEAAGIKPPYVPTIPLLGIYPEESRVEKDTCIPLFTAVLFTIARTRKQPRCWSTDEWIKKLWYIFKTEHYSAIKRNTFESVLMRGMNLETIIQSEVSQKEKDKYSILTYIWNLENWYWRIYLQGSDGETWHREQTYRHGEKGGKGKMYGKSNMETYITICKIDRQWEFAVWLRKLKQELCIYLEGWDGGGEMGGRFKRQGIYVYFWLIHVEVWQKTAKFCKAIILQ